MIITKETTSTANDKKFLLRQYINCNTTFVVYVITCRDCNLQYVGCTTNELNVRIRKHLSDIPHAASRNVSAASLHFAAVHKGNTSGFSAQGIEVVTAPIRGGNRRQKLLSRETYWMFMLETCIPKGLNKKHDLTLQYM